MVHAKRAYSRLHQGSAGLHFRMVKARFPMDADKAAESLGTQLPTEIAEQIVHSSSKRRTEDQPPSSKKAKGGKAVAQSEPTEDLLTVRADAMLAVRASIAPPFARPLLLAPPPHIWCRVYRSD